MSTMKQNPKAGQNRGQLIVFIAIGLIAVLVVVLTLTQVLKPAPTSTPKGTTEPASATPGSGVSPQETTPQSPAAWDGKGTRQLNDVANPKAVFVEFLDFECEACASVLPAIEQLKTTYGDRVSFETRYFPLPSHFNSVYAARAAEAAAQQGKYYEMLQQLYATQTEWGEKQAPEEDRFRSYAKDLGLDMAKWEAAYNSPETLKLIESDVELGKTIGVEGTPTFFLNGKLQQPESMQDLVDAIEGAIKEG